MLVSSRVLAKIVVSLVAYLRIGKQQIVVYFCHGNNTHTHTLSLYLVVLPLLLWLPLVLFVQVNANIAASSRNGNCLLTVGVAMWSTDNRVYWQLHTHMESYMAVCCMSVCVLVRLCQHILINYLKYARPYLFITSACGRSSLMWAELYEIEWWLLGYRCVAARYEIVANILISTHMLAGSLLALMESYFYKVLNQIQLHNFSSDNLLKHALLMLMAHNHTYITYFCMIIFT